MKKVLLFVLKNCPYCVEALRYQEALVRENPAYAGISIEIVDERKEKARADSYDYYYVPTYYVDGVKLHEGALDRGIVKKVLDSALK